MPLLSEISDRMVLKLDEIELLLEKADARIGAAITLFENEYYDDAVSRAYYGMYFAAKALLLTRNISTKTHRGLIRAIGLEFVNNDLLEEYYGKAIHIAEELREKADYSIYEEISKEKADDVIDSAERFLKRIRQYAEEFKRMSGNEHV